MVAKKNVSFNRPKMNHQKWVQIIKPSLKALLHSNASHYTVFGYEIGELQTCNFEWPIKKIT